MIVLILNVCILMAAIVLLWNIVKLISAIRYPPGTGKIAEETLSPFVRAFGAKDGYIFESSAIKQALKGRSYRYARITNVYEEERPGTSTMRGKSLIYMVEYWTKRPQQWKRHNNTHSKKLNNYD